MLKRLWNEEVGAIVSAEIMLVASILVIGDVVRAAKVLAEDETRKSMAAAG